MWALFSVIAALSWATADLLSKIAMNRRGFDEYVTLYARFVFSLPILLLALSKSWPHHIHPAFWIMCILVIPGDIIASTLYIKALKISPISIVVPFMSFAPVFMLLTSPLLLKEWPSITGATGVLLVTAGAYILHINRIQEGLLEPIKAIYKEKGPILVILAAFIFSIDTAFGKKAVAYSDPIFFSFYYCLFMALGYTPLALKSQWLKRNLSHVAKEPLLWGIGLCFAIGVVCFLYAIREANIAYVSALGKISMIVAVIYGRIFFHEEGIRRKIAGVFLMILGIYLIFRG